MTSKTKEDKIVKLLKEIQRRPENKMCADCTSKVGTRTPRPVPLCTLVAARARCGRF
jgi:hypothetical protein